MSDLRGLFFVLRMLGLGLGAVLSVATPAGAEDRMLILSYNICWQCMTNTAAGSAPILGAQCSCTEREPPSSGCARTVCTERMARLIEATPADYGVGNYDFVALQEASNWQALVDAAPATLGRLQAQPYKVEDGHEWAVVLWNGSRYTLSHHFGGDSGRGYAFQVLVFDAARTVFVNVHNCHSHQACSLSTLDGLISRRLIENLGRDGANALRGYRLIVAGDFNQAAEVDSRGQMSIAPLDGAGIPTRVSLQDPPITCCSQDTPWKGRRSGDFIFDSRSVAFPEIPAHDDPNVPRSDHRPVVALLPRWSPGGDRPHPVSDHESAPSFRLPSFAYTDPRVLTELWVVEASIGSGG